MTTGTDKGETPLSSDAWVSEWSPLPALIFIDTDGTQIRLDTDAAVAFKTWDDPTPLTRRQRLMAFALIDLAIKEGRLRRVDEALDGDPVPTRERPPS